MRRWYRDSDPEHIKQEVIAYVEEECRIEAKKRAKKNQRDEMRRQESKNFNRIHPNAWAAGSDGLGQPNGCPCRPGTLFCIVPRCDAVLEFPGFSSPPAVILGVTGDRSAVVVEHLGVRYPLSYELFVFLFAS